MKCFVVRSLVWRFVSTKHRDEQSRTVTEDDVNEIKGEITTMRYEMLEVLEKNGMDISSAERKEKSEYHIKFYKYMTI